MGSPGKQLEPERGHHRAVRGDVLDDRIDPPERRPHLHVDALDVEPAGGLDRRWRLAVIARQPGPAEQDALAAWHRMPPEMIPAPGEEEILLDESMAHAVDLAHGVEAGDRIEPVAQDPEGLGREAPPCLDHACRGGRHVSSRDLGDRRAVSRPARLGGEEVVGRREERLTDDRVLEDVQQVGRVAPHLVLRSVGDLLAELAPGRRPISLGTRRIGRAEQGRDRLADRVVDDETVVAELHEWQRPQTVEGILWSGFGEHRGEQR